VRSTEEILAEKNYFEWAFEKGCKEKADLNILWLALGVKTALEWVLNADLRQIRLTGLSMQIQPFEIPS